MRDGFEIGGVRVEHEPATGVRDEERPPLVFVHGGGHGSWCWERVMPYLAKRGWDGYALNWRHHNGSRELPAEEFIRRGLGDVAADVAATVEKIGRRPVLVAHSMGGLVAQKYAEGAEVEGLVLVTPAFPLQVGGGETIELPLDPTEPWGPPPLEVARELFFQGCDDEEAAHYHSLLCPESPRCVLEVTGGWLVPVDNTYVGCPVLVFGAEEDRLCPPDGCRRTAQYYGGEYRFYRGRGHNLLLDPRWEETARHIAAWLDRMIPGSGAGAPTAAADEVAVA